MRASPQGHHRRGRLLLLASAVAVAAVTTTVALAPDASATTAPSDTGLTVVGKGVVSHEASGGAYEPAVTRAANGDIVAAYPTSSDSNAGGELHVTRSSDNGATWSDPVVLYKPHVFPGGAAVMSVGMTTLKDGTILLPFNEGVNYSKYRNRDSVLFVARSTDNGVTWSGVDTPVQFPVQTREQWAYGKILQLGDGTLVLPLWGSKTLAPDWQKNPDPWSVAVLRSFDNGQTWTSYSTVAEDNNLPDMTAYAGGPNETSVVDLADGRLMAVVRFGNPYPGAQRAYLSYSSDEGATWSAPQASTIAVQSPSLTRTPCSAGLPQGVTKVALGYRNMTGSYLGAPALSVSYDNGVTWQGKLFLQDPDGAPLGGYIGSYPAFTDLGDGTMMVIFMERPNGQNYRIAYNILKDASADQCRQAAGQVAATDTENLTVFVQRGDRDAWPWPYALQESTFGAGTYVRDIARTAATSVTCDSQHVQLVRVGSPDQPLDPDKTLAENGVKTGDVLTVRSLEPSASAVTAGFADYDAYPDDTSVSMWSDGCDYHAALDARNRSLGLHVKTPSGEVVSSISVRDSDATTRLTASNYTLYVSDDNRHYRQVSGWTLTQRTDADGRLVQTFGNLAVSSPYIKIHQSYSGEAYTFVINSMRRDVTVAFSPAS